MKSAKRIEFEKNPHSCGDDGFPVNDKADKNCKTCSGHGIIDTGEVTGCIMDNCPDCHKEKKIKTIN